MRLFVGIELPREIQNKLAELYADLPDLRWVPPENIHLTLCFLGEVGQHRLADLRESLEEAALEGPAAFDISIKGIGQFVRGNSHRNHSSGSVLWAGVEAPPALAKLHERVKRALLEVGLPPERKKFLAHITVARSKFNIPRGINEYMELHQNFTTEPFPVDGFELFSSRLRPEGAVHTIEESYLLAPSEEGPA